MAALPMVPGEGTARLPAAYEAAKQALAECEHLDECKDWSDKAAALASYARQAQDDSLVKHAMRIQGRAVQRSGELLKEFDARPQNAVKPDPEKQKEGTGLLISRTEAGASAGMSERQVKTAVRVANIPKPEFERLIESDNPPTVTALADMGRKPREPGPTHARRQQNHTRRQQDPLLQEIMAQQRERERNHEAWRGLRATLAGILRINATPDGLASSAIEWEDADFKSNLTKAIEYLFSVEEAYNHISKARADAAAKAIVDKMLSDATT
jgi:hypothetical protein